MKKKLFFFAAVVLFGTFAPQAWASYDFSAVAPSGQTLYYNIVSGGVELTYPSGNSNNPYTGYTAPSGDLVIPDSVTYGGTTYPVIAIGDIALGHANITSLVVGNNVTHLKLNCIGDCFSLTSVELGTSVISIGQGAFVSCSALTSIKLKTTTPPSLDWQAFYNTGSMSNKTFYIPAGSLSAYQSASDWGTGKNYVEYYDIVVNGLCYYLTNDSTTVTLGGHSIECTGDIVIPDSIQYNNNTLYVTSIGYSAFEGCTGLTSVTIGSAVTSIGYSAFEGCTGLTSVTIPDAVTSIGDHAFWECSGLTSVTIGSGVTSIGGAAFKGCSGLTSVTIPDAVTSIGYSAFESCTGLTSVTIGSAVTSIGDHAFWECSGLTSVTIGSGVTSIGGAAFKGCSGLHDVICKSIYPPTAQDNTFEGVPAYCTLTVPCGSLTYYSVTEPWNTKFPLMNEDCNSVNTVEEDSAEPTIYAAEGRLYIDAPQPVDAAVYDMTGRRVATLAAGTSTPMPAGVFLVKVGILPARKVVVLR